MAQTKDSAFYCAAKKCRKTAWETPEYLNDYDWGLLRDLIDVLECNAKILFDKILYNKNLQGSYYKTGETNDEIFFNRIIGWPEGIRYYAAATTDCYFCGFIKNDLDKLKGAIENHFNKIEIK